MNFLSLTPAPINDMSLIREKMESGARLEMRLSVQASKGRTTVLIQGASRLPVCSTTLFEMVKDGLLDWAEINSRQWNGVLLTA